VARCLALSPDSRFQSAVEAAQSWAALAPEGPTSQPAPSSPWQQQPTSPGAYPQPARTPMPGQGQYGPPPGAAPQAPPPGFGRTVPLQGNYVHGAPIPGLPASMQAPQPQAGYGAPGVQAQASQGAVMQTAPSVVVPPHLAGPQQRPVPPVLTAQAPYATSTPVPSAKKKKSGASTLLWVMAVFMVLAAAVVVAAVAWIVVQRGGI
jgi:hypothetical protein